MHLRATATGLAALQVGTTARLTGVSLIGASRLRLAEFGLRPGAVVTVLARTAGGGRLLGVGNSRLAVDRRTACRLDVEAVA